MSARIHPPFSVIFAVFALLAFAAISAGAPTTAPADQKAKKVRDTDPVLPEIKFDGVALADVVDYLRDVGGVSIFLDSKGLEVLGVDRGMPVTMHLHKVRLREAIKSMLTNLGEKDHPQLAMDGDVLVISSSAGIKALNESAKALADAKASPAIRAKLDRRLPEIKFDGVGLSDVLEFMKDVTQLSIEADWHQLADAGISRDAPVSMRLADVPVGQVLRLIATSTEVNPPIKVIIRDDKIVFAPAPAEK